MELMETVIENLRTCLLSSQRGINVNKINDEYLKIMGVEIPYEKLNVRNLKELLTDVPGIEWIFKGDECLIQAVPYKKTSHFAKPVQAQKSERKSKLRSERPVKNTLESNETSQNLSSFEPQANTSTTLFPHKENPQQTNSPDFVKKVVDSLKRATSIMPKASSTNNIQNRTSNNPSSVAFQTSTPKNKIVPRTYADPVDELRALTDDLGLTSPTYKTVPAKKGTIYAQVFVDHKTYNSYPEEAKSPRAAQAIAVRKALDDLKERYKSVQLPITRSEKLIKERMLKILDSHPSGVFSSEILRYYKAEFKELLREDWMTIINRWPDIIRMEKAVSGTSILTRYTPLQEKPKIQDAPEVFKWPKDSHILVHVSNVLSTTEIWCQFIGEDYSEKLEEVLRQMKIFYTSNLTSTKAKTIVPGFFYAINLEDTWFRAKCLQYDPKTEEATLFFIDEGKINTYHAKLIHKLDNKFYGLPAQAVRVSLNTLEEFSDFKKAEEIVKNFLLNKNLCIEIQSLDFEVECESVIFYDPQYHLVNLNKLMCIKIIKSCITEPQLKPENCVTEVYMTHHSQSGDIYVRLMNGDMNYLEKQINALIDEKLSRDLSKLVVMDVDLLKLYLVYSRDDKKGYRAVLIDINKETKEVDAFLLDFGRTVTVNINQLVDLESVSTILNNFPAQAIKIQLLNVPPSSFDQEKVTRLKEIVPVNEPILVRVIRRSFNEFPPVVEMYKRKQPSNEIISINNTLIFDSVLPANFDDNNNNNSITRRNLLIKKSN